MTNWAAPKAATIKPTTPMTMAPPIENQPRAIAAMLATTHEMSPAEIAGTALRIGAVACRDVDERRSKHHETDPDEPNPSRLAGAQHIVE